MRHAQRLCILAALVLALSVEAAPSAPAGYRWQHVEDLKAALLVPKHWTLTRVLEREYRMVPMKGDAKTALTINLTRDFGKEFRARDYARSVIALRTQRHLTLDTFDVDRPPFRGFGAVFLLTPDTDPTVRRLFMLANTQTNALYVFTLEAPEARWDAVWEELKPVFEHLRLNEKV